MIWTAVAGARYSIEQIRKRRASVLLGQIWKWCVIVVKSSALLSIWVRIAPVVVPLTIAGFAQLMHRVLLAFNCIIISSLCRYLSFQC